MKNVYFTVGPSQIYPTVFNHMKSAFEEEVVSTSHRGKHAEAIVSETTKRLRTLLRVPKTHAIFFTSSSLESMERIIQNTAGTYSFHYVTGAFSKKFYQTALDLSKKAEKFECDIKNSWNVDSITIPARTEVICITQNETSTGVSIPPAEIAKLKNRYPDKLIAIDAVSSLPYAKLDYARSDMVFFSVQKGFGLPAGLGVLIVSPQALAKARMLKQQGFVTGSYHSFESFANAMEKSQTPETPNLLAIYVLGKVIKDMQTYGIRKIRNETAYKAKLLYAFFDQHPLFTPFVPHTIHRSQTTIVVETGGKTKKLLAKLAKKGMIVGSGYGPYKTTHIRIANFPAHSITGIQKLIRALE